MSGHETGFEPTDPSEDDDLLSPERPAASAGAPEPESKSTDAPAGGEEPETETEPPLEEESAQDRPRSHGRELIRAAWVLVTVVAVIGAIGLAELIRISTALDNSACIQRAQADIMGSTGPGVSAQYAGLGRLSALNQLKKCGQ